MRNPALCASHGVGGWEEQGGGSGTSKLKISVFFNRFEPLAVY